MSRLIIHAGAAMRCAVSVRSVGRDVAIQPPKTNVAAIAALR